MKIKKVIATVICVLLGIYIAFSIIKPCYNLELSRCQSAKLTYINDGTEIHENIKLDDYVELTDMLQGNRKFKDTPSCGFDKDVSIIFWSPEHREITICPACDGCPLMRIGDGDYYIKLEDSERARFNEIVEKYGMVFPCI